MKTMLSQLNEMIGTYVGEGVNHEGQSFTGRLQIQSLLEGRGFQLKFSATGKDGTVYHKEESTIAPCIREKLTLWNFNTNTPGLVPHELRKNDAKSGAQASFVFGFNQPIDKSTFREEVALDIWDKKALSYTYSWGLPGGDFQERSSVRVARQTIDTNSVEFLSAALLISKDAKKLANFYRDVIGVPLEDEKHGETEPHYGCELGDLHFAIHPLENFKDTGCGTGSVKLAFTVFDMNSFVKKVESHGVKLAYPPKDTGFAIMTALNDPDGNYVEFTQLSNRWFGHLKNRKENGFDVVHQWEQLKNGK
jgi:predicted enzyme related to lactoylglutathione lyase